MRHQGFTVEELLARPDADETFERLASTLGEHALPDGEIVVTLTGIAVLRARAAAERHAAELEARRP